MSKRDKSVIWQSVKREMAIIKNIYFNYTSSASGSIIIYANNEDQVIFTAKIIAQDKSNCMLSLITGCILQITTKINYLTQHHQICHLIIQIGNEQNVLTKSTSPNVSPLYLHKELNELPTPVSLLYSHNTFSSK